jgi:TM2 domain-containing membrane protein YozV
MDNRRRLPVAVVLSLLVPGTGRIYHGQKQKALWGYSSVLTIPIVFVVFDLFHSVRWLLSFPGLWVHLCLGNLTDAFVCALRSQKTPKVKSSFWFAIKHD